VSRTKSAFFSGRGAAEANRREQKALFGKGHIKFFRRPQELQSKKHWKKIQIYFVFLYLVDIYYQLANKTRNLLFTIQFLI
jgi:hypothetical protein